jgi:hypothetical protein
MVAFSYITTKRKSFPHVPDQMPLLYSPNNTFLVKSSLDYYLDKKQLAGGTEYDTRMGKLNVSATGKFFQRAEVSALLRAADYKYDGYAADVSQYLLQGGMKIYLYDTVETKLLPGVDYRHLEIVNNSADVPVIRLERWITPSFTLTTTFGNTILLTTTVNQDVLYGWSQRNTSTNGYSYIDYKKHDRILNFSAGLTMFY